jgi:hypothetical protein
MHSGNARASFLEAPDFGGRPRVDLATHAGGLRHHMAVSQAKVKMDGPFPRRASRALTPSLFELDSHGQLGIRIFGRWREYP